MSTFYTYTAIASLDAEWLAPPTGTDWISVAGLPWDPAHRSVLESADPAAANGDVIEWEIVTTPGAFGVTMYADGTFELAADDYTQQTFDYRLWRPATGWTAAATVTLAISNEGIGNISGGGGGEGQGITPLGQSPTTEGRIHGGGSIVAIGERPIVLPALELIPLASSALNKISNRSTVEPDYGIEADETDDGDTRQRLIYPAPQYRLTVVWDMLTFAEASEAEFLLHQGREDLWLVPLAGDTYKARLIEPPVNAYRTPFRRRLTGVFVGVRL